MKKLEGMLLYCALQDPVPCFEKTKGKEWKVSVVVDEDTADEFAEIYKKQAAKKVKRSEFKDTYNVEPPEGSSKNLYVITLRRNTQYKKNGEMVNLPDQYRPRLKQRNEEGELEDITDSVLVANGSYGQVTIDHYETEQYGASARLKNVLVTELIEYVRTQKDDDDEFDDAPVTKRKGSVNEDAKAEKPKAKPKTKKQQDDDDDADPFKDEE